MLRHAHLVDEALGQVLLQAFLHVQLFAEGFAPVDTIDHVGFPVHVLVSRWEGGAPGVHLPRLVQVDIGMCCFDDRKRAGGRDDRLKRNPSEKSRIMERLQRIHPVFLGWGIGLPFLQQGRIRAGQAGGEAVFIRAKQIKVPQRPRASLCQDADAQVAVRLNRLYGLPGQAGVACMVRVAGV